MWPGAPIRDTSMLLPPADWCPVFAVWTTAQRAGGPAALGDQVGKPTTWTISPARWPSSPRIVVKRELSEHRMAVIKTGSGRR